MTSHSPSATPPLSRVRAAATAALGALAAAASLWALISWGSAGPFTATRSARADEVVGELMVWAAVALSGWLGLGSLLAVGATVPGAVGAACQATSRWLTPRLLRQGVAVAIGTAVATLSLPVGPAAAVGTVRGAGVTQPGEERGDAATAATRHTALAPVPDFAPTGRGSASVPVMNDVAVPAPDGHTASTGAPGPGWRPTPPPPRADPRRARLLAPAPRAGTALDGRVTVRRGDSLWTIAARHLGPGASDAEIALAWPRWYAANRGLIGADPDRLVPGQQLTPPPAGEDP
jgi:hypothetical protein